MMSLLTQFDPPGLLSDLDGPQRTAWSEWISESVDAAVAGDSERSFNAPRPQFFNPTKKEIADDAAEVSIEWGAFPRQVKSSSISDKQRWQRADASRDMQDEYCEWSVERDPDSGKVVRVAFTCEGPEYWTFLAATNPTKVLELYRQFVSPSVQPGDLFKNGNYLPRNMWNNSTTNGAMHLIQRSNTLNAEIELAAGATILRSKNGTLLTEEQALIRCGRYGEPGRNSDPHIGAMVNSIARRQADITLKNPVGLYFADVDFQNWETPDGSPAASYWKYVRGDRGFEVRAVYEVPADKPFVAGDIEIDGKRLEFGGQIADRINMKLIGVGCRFGQRTDVSPMTGCVDDPLATVAAFAERGMRQLSVREALLLQSTRTR
jgi:hypothetical protein